MPKNELAVVAFRNETEIAGIVDEPFRPRASGYLNQPDVVYKTSGLPIAVDQPLHRLITDCPNTHSHRCFALGGQLEAHFPIGRSAVTSTRRVP